ncbi:MAG TPA: hypothetical protein VM802_05100 [Chitinophaga sp.]|uniref:hypothetical protein n=1 Tax=Chitinophaga sp. TaxID=1869181 RepID=UPI002C2B047C|nr:hypothetical protein [Chitinophaga sp.]HVI44219.1 hypothetical protein [Chitinophaga sp.]
MKKCILILLMSITVHGLYAQQPARKVPDNGYSRFRFAINGGYSYRLAKISPDLNSEARNYFKKLKSGFNVSADVLYYFNESLGAGIKYSRFQTSKSDVLLVDVPNSGRMRTTVGDNMAFNFFAATFATRFYNKKQTNFFYANLSLGYLNYYDDGWVHIQKAKLTGGTVGFGWDLGYDVRITRRLSAGAQLSLISGKLSSITREDGYGRTKVQLEGDQKESLSHLNISAGIRWNL